MVVNLKAHVGRTEQISRHYLALRRMLWRHFSAEEPWVLEWIRIPSDTCGGVNSIWIRYVWTGKFLNPERKSCGFKNIRIRVDGANSTANPEKNKSALQSVKKYIRNECDNVWTGESGYFLSGDVKSVSNLSPNNKPIWRHNVEGERSKFPATISLHGAWSEDILVQRSLGYYSESG